MKLAVIIYIMDDTEADYDNWYDIFDNSKDNKMNNEWNFEWSNEFFFEKFCCGAKFEFGAFAEIGRVEKKDVGHL